MTSIPLCVAACTVKSRRYITIVSPSPGQIKHPFNSYRNHTHCCQNASHSYGTLFVGQRTTKVAGQSPKSSRVTLAATIQAVDFLPQLQNQCNCNVTRHCCVCDQPLRNEHSAVNILLSLLPEDLKLTHLHHSPITGTGLSPLQLALSWISQTVMIHYGKETLSVSG